MLASPTSAIHIHSIILETCFLEWFRGQPIPSILEPDNWLPIDTILASSIFVDLHTVEVIVNDHMTHGSGMQQKRIDFMALLPTISCHSRISLMASTTPVTRRHTVIYEMYLYGSWYMNTLVQVKIKDIIWSEISDFSSLFFQKWSPLQKEYRGIINRVLVVLFNVHSPWSSSDVLFPPSLVLVPPFHNKIPMF